MVGSVKPPTLAAVRVDDASSVPIPEERPEQQADRWAIRVDGWGITFDRGEVARVTPLFRPEPVPARLAPEVAEVPPPHRPPSEYSPYDEIFAKYAAKHGLDWRLVRAVAFQESGFQPAVEGHAGAYGLMQVTPEAAREVGENAFESPERNISAGVRYLDRLAKMFPNARGRDRIALTLAAYNLGPGHVRDAQLLAQRFGYDANRWRGALEDVLPLLEEPSVSAELPGGFARGNRGVDYVNRVMERYDRYCAVLGKIPVSGSPRAID